MKICVVCKDKKSVTEFNRSKRRKDGRQPHCRECNRKHSRDYYSRNRDKHKRVVTDRKKKQVRINHEFVYDYLAKHPCVDCKETDPIVLEFDHVRGSKRDNIAHLMAAGCSIKTLVIEIAKCKVRCANCHRRRTYRHDRSYRHVLWLQKSTVGSTPMDSTI